MTQTIEQLTARVAELEKELLKTKMDLLTSYGESEELLGRIAELEEENARLSDGAVCGDCDGSGWLENRVEGRYPCTCMTEAEPYQLLTEQLAAEQLNNKLLREALDKTRGALAYVKANGIDNPNLMESTAWHGLAAADKALATIKESEAK